MAEDRTFNLNFIPNRVQRAFIESRAKADLFSSRRGEGKSTALAWACFVHTRHNPNANWAFLRDTYENMQKTTQRTFFEWFPPGVAGTYNHTRKEFTWAEGLAKGTVTFAGMDDPSDASKLLSWELGGVAMDEPAPAVTSGGIDEMVFDLATTSLRQPSMAWYPMKLAENNPDETHWTYKKFVVPGTEGYALWQPPDPENVHNLPLDYYENMRRALAHRPDLQRRFVDGEFGFQSMGVAVTPQWSDKLHLALGLVPVPRQPLFILWDFGHNPTAIITQITPAGQWLILDALVGEGIGVEELIENEVRPLLLDRYKGFQWSHIGDPAGRQREQTSIVRTPVRALKRSLGGTFKSGPVSYEARLEPLRSVLTKTVGGTGLVQVDRHRARAVWHALRGGWHFPVSRNGVVGGNPVKSEASHPGDAMSYGAAVLFPIGRLRKSTIPSATSPSYFGKGEMVTGPLGVERPGLKIPPEGATLEEVLKGRS